MSESTHSLGLPFLMASQAQKHVTHNEALLGLDALVHLSVLSRVATEPPAIPAEGDRYLVAVPAGGDWTGLEGTIAAFQDGIWRHHTPAIGWRVWVADEARLLVYDSPDWRSILSASDLQNLPLLGVNASADAANKLAVKSAAVLFDNAGAGSQVKVNKAAAGDTASHLFQTGYSGRAEFGLTGDDDFHAKVSPDGSAWFDSLLIDKDTGVVTFPSGLGEAATWTPAVSFLTNGDFSPTYTVQVGEYERVGKLVRARFNVTFSCNAYTTASSRIQISGLPFTARASSLGAFGGYLSRIENIIVGSSFRIVAPVVDPGAALVNVRLSATATTASYVSAGNIPASTANVVLNGEVIYPV